MSLGEEKKTKKKITEKNWQPKKNQSKEVSQRRKLTAKKSHSEEVHSQPRWFTAKKIHSEEVSQRRRITAKKNHSKEVSRVYFAIMKCISPYHECLLQLLLTVNINHDNHYKSHGFNETFFQGPLQPPSRWRPVTFKWGASVTQIDCSFLLGRSGVKVFS
jgi:hypothetical protein